MKLFDTQAHFNFEELAENVEKVVTRSRDAVVCGQVNAVTEPSEFEAVLELAEKIEGIYAALRYHAYHKNIQDRLFISSMN
ncbi:MAG: TatD family hydrolase [Planctomycetota bacterium]|jgi:Tat protein secretion system quality control protein TatD with DNase activity